MRMYQVERLDNAKCCLIDVLTKFTLNSGAL